MATIQGIQFENDPSGKPISIKINLEKYGTQLEPFLKKIGIIEEEDDFVKEFENAISSEEFLKRTINTIKNLPWKE